MINLSKEQKELLVILADGLERIGQRIENIGNIVDKAGEKVEGIGREFDELRYAFRKTYGPCPPPLYT